ncbi:MAG: alginate export family protein [Planctomycetes bacterium]|nr:alginate export family protein [Planctomycetota bacterium]
MSGVHIAQKWAIGLVAPVACWLMIAAPSLRAETAGYYQEESDQILSPLKKIPLGPTSLTVGGQLRDRYEVRNNYDFNDGTDNNDSLNFTRVRLNLDWAVREYFRAFVQLQDSEVFGLRANPDPPRFEDRMDFQQAYLDFKVPVGPALTFRLGRQEIVFGDERLVGAFDWLNVGRTFDSARLILEPENWRMDLFAAEEVIHDRLNLNHPSHKDLFSGIHASTTRWENRVVDAYAYVRHREDVMGEDGRRDDSTGYTLGLRTKATVAQNWDYDFEGAVQAGDSGTDDFFAGAVHWGGGYTFKEKWAEPRVAAEYSFATGDEDPADGDEGTFDNLFPTSHKFYGYMDFFSLRNLHNPAVSLLLKPAKAFKVKLDYHWFWLVEEKDAWFNALGDVVRQDKTGQSGSEVGQELDLLLTYDLNSHFSFWFGYSHFFAGDYVQRTSAARAQDDADFIYVMMILNF